jgi:hypothetical protein
MAKKGIRCDVAFKSGQAKEIKELEEVDETCTDGCPDSGGLSRLGKHREW